MKKVDVIKLVNAGIVNVTAYDLKPEHAYQVFKLKREVEKIHRDIEEEYKEIEKSQGLTEEFAEETQKVLDKVNNKEELTDADKATLTKYDEIWKKVIGLKVELGKTDVSIDVKPLPYEEWRTLQKENKAKKIGDREIDILGGVAEIILSENFWQEPV